TDVFVGCDRRTLFCRPPAQRNGGPAKRTPKRHKGKDLSRQRVQAPETCPVRENGEPAGPDAGSQCPTGDVRSSQRGGDREVARGRQVCAGSLLQGGGQPANSREFPRQQGGEE